MKTFVIAVSVLNALAAIGMVKMIRDGDFTRNPNTMVWDVVLMGAIAVWGAFLLGAA